MAGSKYAPDCLKEKDYGQRCGCLELIFHRLDGQNAVKLILWSYSETMLPLSMGRSTEIQTAI